VGLSEITLCGNLYANAAFSLNVMGISNELPRGMMPNMVGGLVVFPFVRSDEDVSSMRSWRAAISIEYHSSSRSSGCSHPLRARDVGATELVSVTPGADSDVLNMDVVTLDRLALGTILGVMGDSRLLGQFMVRFEHCAGQALLLLVMLKLNV
jgi:hypothetical protein